MADAAVASAWAFFERSSQRGMQWDEVAGCRTLADYRAKLAASPDGLVDTCRALLDYNMGLTDPERDALRAVLEITEILSLRQPPRTRRAPAPESAPAPAPVQAVEATSPDLTEPVVPEPAVAAPQSARARARKTFPLPLWQAALVALGALAILLALWIPRPPEGGSKPAHTLAPAPPLPPPPTIATAAPTRERAVPAATPRSEVRQRGPEPSPTPTVPAKAKAAPSQARANIDAPASAPRAGPSPAPAVHASPPPAAPALPAVTATGAN